MNKLLRPENHRFKENAQSPVTSDHKTSFLHRERTSVINTRTIYRKGLINCTCLSETIYYYRIKYIIFKSSSSKYNEVFHYYLYLIKELSCAQKPLHSAQLRSSIWYWINIAGSNKSRCSQAQAGSRGIPAGIKPWLMPHLTVNWSSCHRPSVKFCLVGVSDKYWDAAGLRPKAKKSVLFPLFKDWFKAKCLPASSRPFSGGQLHHWQAQATIWHPYMESCWLRPCPAKLIRLTLHWPDDQGASGGVMVSKLD